MKNSVKDQLNTALREMDWHGEEAVLRRIRQRRVQRCPRPSRTLAFAALLLISLIATAFALTLHFSADYRFVRQALTDQYGLTEEMLDLFTATINGDEVTFVSQQHSVKLGEYTVRMEKDGELSAAWSHDGADEPLLSDSFLAQARMLIRRYAAGQLNDERFLALLYETAEMVRMEMD